MCLLQIIFQCYYFCVSPARLHGDALSVSLQAQVTESALIALAMRCLDVRRIAQCEKKQGRVKGGDIGVHMARTNLHALRFGEN